jgi:hypothetical protein
MYAPGAVEDRLAMGTLEGLHHREYVEGADDDYVTSALTSPDCTFSRFLRVRTVTYVFEKVLHRADVLVQVAS